MGFFDFNKRTETKGGFIYVSEQAKTNSYVNFQGEVERREVKFPKELGEEHPFDFKITEDLYKKFGLVTAIVDKYVDFVWGNGFYIECEDERAKQIIDDWIRDVDFPTLGRQWFKEGLLKTGFMELGGKKDESVKGAKILDGKYMYIQRDKYGNILGYNQYKGAFDKFSMDKNIHFEPYQIALLALNKVGSDIYGYGIVYPMIKFIDDYINLNSNMHIIMERKANSPIHAKIGDAEHIPDPSVVADFGKKLEWLHNKHEWATDGLIDIKAIDFGNIGDKFTDPLRNDFEKIVITSQVPEVILGGGRIPEGLAKEQAEVFERRIQSFQCEAEKIIESQIFKRILNSNGLDIHVEFQWGEKNEREKNERATQLIEALKLFNLSPKAVSLLEEELIRIMDLDFEALQDAEEEREEEEEQPQPKVPGTKAREVYIGELVE